MKFLFICSNCVWFLGILGVERKVLPDSLDFAILESRTKWTTKIISPPLKSQGPKTTLWLLDFEIYYSTIYAINIVRYNIKKILRNSMGGSWTMRMLYLLFKGLQRRELQRFGAAYIQKSHMSLTLASLCQKKLLKSFLRLQIISNMIWFQLLEGRALLFIR